MSRDVAARRIYTLFLVCAALTAAVVIVFFVIGLNDGSVSSFNAGLWSLILSVMGASLWGGHALHASGRVGLAITALAVTAVPGMVAALFVVLLLVTEPRWN